MTVVFLYSAKRNQQSRELFHRLRQYSLERNRLYGYFSPLNIIKRETIGQGIVFWSSNILQRENNCQEYYFVVLNNKPWEREQTSRNLSCRLRHYSQEKASRKFELLFVYKIFQFIISYVLYLNVCQNRLNRIECGQIHKQVNASFISVLFESGNVRF